MTLDQKAAFIRAIHEILGAALGILLVGCVFGTTLWDTWADWRRRKRRGE